jgi:hypothetical protein
MGPTAVEGSQAGPWITPLQHKDTSDNTTHTYFDFTDENYKRVRKFAWENHGYAGEPRRC